jgi:hypothetical protein
MKRLLGDRGSFIGEYVIIIGVVLAAVFAMGPYIGERIRGAIALQANNYQTAAGNAAGFDPNQTQQSESNSRLEMNTAYTGSAISTSDSKSRTDF